MDQQKYPEKCGLLGKLPSGEKKLDGKTFYFDRVKKRSVVPLLEVITRFGGKVESFLHKEVSYVVTGCLDELSEHKASHGNTSEETAHSKQDSGLRHDQRKQGIPRPAVNACGSRGKALLEKAILNKRQQGTSVLTNARSWGVKILYADDVLGYLKLMSQESFNPKSKKSEKAYNKQCSNVVKAAPLRSPYLKIEDSSRKYKPLHMQSMTFPSLYYSGKYSPFECPPPPRFDKWTEPEEKKNKKNQVVVSTEEECMRKCQTPLSCNPSPWKPHIKNAYCECCRQSYNNQEEHLQSDHHRAFVLDGSKYSSVDQLIAAMVPCFNLDPPQQPEEQENSTIEGVCELEPLSDMETEDAVKALQTQVSNFMPDIPVLVRDTNSSFIDNPPSKIQQPTNNPNADIAVLPLSPLMPVLEMMPQELPLLEPQQDLSSLSPCPVNVSQNLDPLPPVLSPQIAETFVHSSFLEPPILSPQQFTSPESKDDQTDNESSVSHCFPVNSHHSMTTAITAAKSSEKSQAEIKVCCNSWERRSRSVPRRSSMAINSKKRCRSASPESSLCKRRRTDEMGGYEANYDHKTEMTRDVDSLLFERNSSNNIQSQKTVRTLQSFCTNETQESIGLFNVPQVRMAAHSVSAAKSPPTDAPLSITVDKSQNVSSSHNSEHSNAHSTSVCIESALIPDVAAFSSSSSDSDWDCELLSRLGAPPKTTPTPNDPICDLDQNLLQQPCPWMHDSSYESRLHSVLQTPAKPMTVETSAFSRTVVQIVEVQH